jgi:hypothetical protein
VKNINVNFVSLHLNAFKKIVNNKDLHYRDVALFHALLAYWNKYRFPEVFSINRQELMSFSKIGSPNTYLKAIRSLHRLGFIQYFPSNDPSKGSKVKICINKSEVCQKLTNDRHMPDLSLSSSINNSKLEETRQTPKKKEVIQFFIDNGSTQKLAEQCYDHNQAFGWIYNGSPIKDWKAFVKNYIRRDIVKTSQRIKTDKSASEVSKKSTFGDFKKDKS